MKKSADPMFPRTFIEACKSPDWRAAIDREYKALVNRKTWEYIDRRDDMQVLQFTWAFKRKPLDHVGKKFLCKARRNIRGDYQNLSVNYDPHDIYAPVASHEATRLLLATSAKDNLILEGGDISNTYLYGLVDCEIYIWSNQLTQQTCWPTQARCESLSAPFTD